MPVSAPDARADTRPEARADGRVIRTDLANLAARVLLARRARPKHFGPASAMFGEPAYDMLLDLFVARHGGVELTVTDACLGSGGPPTTGIRCIRHLIATQMVAQTGDPKDGRRQLVRLTEAGIDAVERHLLSFGL